TADHGHALVSRDSVVTLDAHPDVRSRLMAPPLGGSRVPYLLALPGQEGELRTACCSLEDRYHLLDSREMLDRGLFGAGAEPPEVRPRIGTLMPAPRGDSTFHRSDPAYFSSPLRGDHDALSAEEMAVPLLMWES